MVRFVRLTCSEDRVVRSKKTKHYVAAAPKPYISSAATSEPLFTPMATKMLMSWNAMLAIH